MREFLAHLLDDERDASRRNQILMRIADQSTVVLSCIFASCLAQNFLFASSREFRSAPARIWFQFVETVATGNHIDEWLLIRDEQSTGGDPVNLVVVSNRVARGKAQRTHDGGLAAALLPVVEKSGAIWVGSSGRGP